jgi:hypothetical protein
MNRRIVQVMIGSRPALDESYLRSKTLQTNPIQAYRHIIAYALIARALKKCLRGLTPHEVREWLSRDTAWLDKNTLDDYRGPLVINGELPPTLLGVQAALGAWLENATNWVANLKVGNADVNIHKGALINPAMSRIKQQWSRYLCHIDDIDSLTCVDTHTGLKARYEANDRFYGGDREDFLTLYKKRNARFLLENSVANKMSSVRGTQFQLTYWRSVECQKLTRTGASLWGDPGSGMVPLCALTDVAKVYGEKDGKWLQITPQEIPNHRRFRVLHGPLLVEHPKALWIQLYGPVYEISRSFKSTPPTDTGEDAEELLKAAIDPFDLHDKALRGDYIDELPRKLDAQIDRQRAKLSELKRKIPTPEARGNLDQKAKANIARWEKSQEKRTKKVELLIERKKQVSSGFELIQPEDMKHIYIAIRDIQMEDPRTRAGAAGAPPTYQKRSIALLALGWQDKYLPPLSSIPAELHAELAQLETTDRQLQQRGVAPPAAAPMPSPPIPSGKSARAVKLANVGLSLKYDVSPMQKKIVKVITGKRPDLDKSYLARKGLTAGKDEDLRHIIPHVLLAKALRQCIKGLTPAQVATWLDQPEAWLDSGEKDRYLKPLLDGVGLGGAQTYGLLMRTVGTVQAALDAWLTNATNFFKNLYAGSSKINKSKGASINPAKYALKQSWRRYLCKASQILFISSRDQQTGTRVSYRVLEPSHGGQLLGSVGTAIGRDILERHVNASSSYDPSTAPQANGGFGALLISLPGAKFRILFEDDRELIGPGALLIDVNGHVFQVSREFSLIERRLDGHYFRTLDLAPQDSTAAGSEHQSRSRAFLKAAIDPKTIQETPLDEIDDGGDLTEILTAIKGLRMKRPMPSGLGDKDITLVDQNVVEVALGASDKYIVEPDQAAIKTRLLPVPPPPSALPGPPPPSAGRGRGMPRPVYPSGGSGAATATAPRSHPQEPSARVKRPTTEDPGAFFSMDPRSERRLRLPHYQDNPASAVPGLPSMPPHTGFPSYGGGPPMASPMDIQASSSAALLQALTPEVSPSGLIQLQQALRSNQGPPPGVSFGPPGMGFGPLPPGMGNAQLPPGPGYAQPPPGMGLGLPSGVGYGAPRPSPPYQPPGHGAPSSSASPPSSHWPQPDPRGRGGGPPGYGY